MNGWYRNLALRERQFVLLGAIIILLTFAYAFIYEPLEVALEESKTRLGLKQSEWAQLVRISDEYKKIGLAKNTASAKDNRSLLAVIDQTGSAVGVKPSIKRLTPEGKNKVRVRVEDVAFDRLTKWLVTNSTKNSIHAELFLARKAGASGKVNATLLFTRD